MQISLPSELEELVRTNVASGVYASADDVICAALQLWKEHTDSLKEEIGRGIDEADRKVFSSMSLEDLKAEGRRRLNNQKH
ncbi:type II toxin-antitoxin system ParD family antitoxin [Chlorogloeopsis sp. ULAP01]|jgi:putative addiction module CopG family antidote|uniref:ribbon-helix-helix domain-containing protein n=1 Tax=Chlorogloeopsis sp. ULAP01 TaxID=3056483 RepID=UPI0025AB5C09|nr:type II toxin-antitoxin system ParD family antitoxin [Chlorogloeopsis sp. ULAP01]MDM9383513.1 type II toxin-antitoxin system ParD family antitoxin [Chlorogloeopsis sp. ULAP01]